MIKSDLRAKKNCFTVLHPQQLEKKKLGKCAKVRRHVKGELFWFLPVCLAQGREFLFAEDLVMEEETKSLIERYVKRSNLCCLDAGDRVDTPQAVNRRVYAKQKW